MAFHSSCVLKARIHSGKNLNGIYEYKMTSDMWTFVGVKYAKVVFKSEIPFRAQSPIVWEHPCHEKIKV